MDKYVAYYRVSTSKQGRSGLGIDAQTSGINHFCPGEIVATFTDHVSGKESDNRPELQKAIKLCQDNGYILAVYKVDRLARNAVQALTIYRNLKGKLWSADCPTEGGYIKDELMLGILCLIAERESKLIAIRAKATHEARLNRANGDKGIYSGVAENLTAEARDKAMQVRKDNANNAEEWRKAHIAAQKYKADGFTLREIANALNNTPFRTRRGKEFTATTVQRLLNKKIQIEAKPAKPAKKAAQ